MSASQEFVETESVEYVTVEREEGQWLYTIRTPFKVIEQVDEVFIAGRRQEAVKFKSQDFGSCKIEDTINTETGARWVHIIPDDW